MKRSIPSTVMAIFLVGLFGCGSDKSSESEQVVDKYAPVWKTARFHIDGFMKSKSGAT